MTENERLAYLAGIIDGEGCVGAWNRRAKSDRRKRHAELSIRVAMTTPYAVKMLHEAFGGSLFAEKRHSGKRRQTFAWVVCNRKAENCLRALLPFLQEKLEQADVALAMVEFGRRCRVGSGRPLTDEEFTTHEAYVDRLKELKRQEFAATALQ